LVTRAVTVEVKKIAAVAGLTINQINRKKPDARYV